MVGELNAKNVNMMLVAFALNGFFIHVQKIDFDSFILQKGSIAYNYSFLSCLPCCFKTIISIWMIATVQDSGTLAEFIQLRFDGFVSFVRRAEKRKERKKAIIKGSITIVSVSRG